MRRAEIAAAIGGCVLVFGALGIIWVARLSVRRELYLSELGAEGEPTAKWFQASLLLIVVGGSVVAWAGRRVRSSPRILSAWTPSISLWIGCSFFLFVSQVTCTAGCPLPYGDTFTWQNFLHTVAAVLAFASACWAMLQSSFAQHHRVLRVFSGTMGILVAVIAGTGGVLSLLRFHQDFGSWLEFVATTLAIAWLVVFGAVLAAQGIRSLAHSRATVQENLAAHEGEHAIR